MLATASGVSSTLGAVWVTAFVIGGSFVFGLSGGLAGTLKRLDVFGVVVLAAVVGMAGGVLRDVMLGIPAVVVFDWRVVLAVVLAGVTAFVAHGPLLRWHHSIQILDALGLSLFSVIGTDIALHHHAGPIPAVLLGMVTGVGGGAIRDVVTNEVPAVLRGGLYAIPSLLGASAVALGYELHHISLAWYAAAAGICFVVRLAGILFKLNLPRPRL